MTDKTTCALNILEKNKFLMILEEGSWKRIAMTEEQAIDFTNHDDEGVYICAKYYKVMIENNMPKFEEELMKKLEKDYIVLCSGSTYTLVNRKEFEQSARELPDMEEFVINRIPTEMEIWIKKNLNVEIKSFSRQKKHEHGWFYGEKIINNEIKDKRVENEAKRDEEGLKLLEVLL